MPEQVERPVTFPGRSMEYANNSDGDDIQVRFSGLAKDGTKLSADFLVRKPPGHESLTVVVPWTLAHFQLNCKENTRPCEGSVTVGDRRYVMDPNDCHAVQDFGRAGLPQAVLTVIHGDSSAGQVPCSPRPSCEWKEVDS